MSITASTPSKRLALAPINLNVKSPLFNKSSSSPLIHKSSSNALSTPKQSKLSPSKSKTNITNLLNSCSRPLSTKTTPNHLLNSHSKSLVFNVGNDANSNKNLLPLMRTASTLSPSATRSGIIKNASPRGKSLLRRNNTSSASFTSSLKSSSFSDYKISNNRNATADLAATKLKLKLQLAFYKVQQQLKQQLKKYDASHYISQKSSTKITRDVSPTTNQNNTIQSEASTPATFIMNNSYCSTTVTPPSPSNKNYQSSININLQTKLANNTSKVTKPSLSSIAYKKHPKSSIHSAQQSAQQQLKLFSIKKTSSYYHDTNKLPLLEADLKSTTPTITTFRHQSQSQPSNNKTLPSIHKILKTPIKSSSTRSLVYNNNNNINNNTTNNDETIIDESSLDDTSSLAINIKKRTSTKLNDLLSSSPLSESHEKQPGNFGTPNSFSVAKSLLQLGSGYY